MNSTIAKAFYIAIGLLVASWFITASVNWIGTGQDNIVTEIKKIENY